LAHGAAKSDWQGRGDMNPITWTETKALTSSTYVANHDGYRVEIRTTIRHRSEKTVTGWQGSVVWFKVITRLPVWEVQRRTEAWMRGGPLKLPGRQT
jgi:hypothetical protein